MRGTGRSKLDSAQAAHVCVRVPTGWHQAGSKKARLKGASGPGEKSPSRRESIVTCPYTRRSIVIDEKAHVSGAPTRRANASTAQQVLAM